MNAFIQGKNPSGTRQPVDVNTRGALLTVADSGVPTFLNVTANNAAAALAATAGTRVAIKNTGSVSVSVGRTGQTATWTLAAGVERVFPVVADASELNVKTGSSTAALEIEVSA